MTTENHPTDPRPAEPRLLPWPSPEGKPCYLISDGDGGRISDLADDIEELQLDLASEVLTHSRTMLSAAEPPRPVELRFVAYRLAESLHDALRVAESRGRRLP
ncbi:hypothetical protein [Streptomyces sp. NPDC047108]|uniref:hypothetical protein n=1 Tax=Streptomyces sp. NPDC047108 TaxID=3155025 RepID=UPI003409063D